MLVDLANGTLAAEPEEDTNGIPQGDRGQGSRNAGKSIKDWRAGKGSV
jgi:hypothetical protein